MNKECRDCRITKPLDAFSPDARCKLGRYATCRECRNRQGQEWRERKGDEYKEYQRNYRRANRPFREPKLAQLKVRYAVVTGALAKPDRCGECGEIGFVGGHHSDYSKPLNVEWLCRACHARRHWVEGSRVTPRQTKALIGVAV